MRDIEKSPGFLQYQKLKRRRTMIILLCQIILLVGILGIWEFITAKNIVDYFIISSPSRIFAVLKQYTISNEIFKHIGISVLETLLGLFIGTTLGILIAVILWLSPFFAKVVDPFLVVLNALPKTALAPIFIIMVGANMKGIVFTAISISIILTIISSYNYFKAVDVEKIKMMKAFQASKFQTLRMLILPANTNNLFNTVKINIGMAWIGVVIAEFIVSRAGLGYLMTIGMNNFNLNVVMMSVMMVALITLLMYGIVSIIEKLYYILKGW